MCAERKKIINDAGKRKNLCEISRHANRANRMLDLLIVIAIVRNRSLDQNSHVFVWLRFANGAHSQSVLVRRLCLLDNG